MFKSFQVGFLSILAIMPLAWFSIMPMNTVAVSRDSNFLDSRFNADNDSHWFLRECDGFNIKDDEYSDEEVNATKVVDCEIKEHELQYPSWSSMAILSVLWCLCFTFLEPLLLASSTSQSLPLPLSR
eukprot:CAMPEP_0183727778 /NCGR_PEP_ID=MMETSP0737-20130205/26370_1 /TAXON_ID=385413 /ORGANISM="Thalassiosira miniscula, Strain CCMP1093" /LENGTH=126 /DNA_ID=CAMNT_0025959499 /DNA_START=111 /DNA_END=491 /DNA_ORIENTATION=+